MVIGIHVKILGYMYNRKQKIILCQRIIKHKEYTLASLADARYLIPLGNGSCKNINMLKEDSDAYEI